MSDTPDHDKQMRINAMIDENLKRVYGDLQKDSIPNKFKDLLIILAAQEAEEKIGPDEYD